MSARLLPLAVRAFTVRKKRRPRRNRRTYSEPRWAQYVLIVDTETTTDTSQRLLFGSYHFCEWSKDGTRLLCREEGLFYADDLERRNPKAFRRLLRYAANHDADVGRGFRRRLRLLTRTGFVEEVLWKLAYRTRATVVGFNLPFDLSRIALDVGCARKANRGGFSLVLWGRRVGRGRKWKPNPYRPRLTIRHLDSKKAFIQFTRIPKTDSVDQRPADGYPVDPGFHYKGRFLDLRTLTFALTSENHSLDSAGKAFGIAHGKGKAGRHGTVTAKYIEYNRRDVLATQELLEKLRAEFDRHPIDLTPEKAYSPASIAKAYLRKMRLRLPREQFHNIAPKYLGYAMSAFYGGRAEARIRKTPVPVVYTDFTSMYPTVQSLMGLWEYLSAEEISVERATGDVRRLLGEVSTGRCFDPQFWRELVGFALVEPSGNILPARAKYNDNEWNVGVNRLTSDATLWYALPDLVASTLLTGKPPKILRAFRLVPRGRQEGLRPVRLRGEVPVDPKRENLFRSVIESRQRVKADPNLDDSEKRWTEKALKMFANAGSYGVFVEMNVKPTRRDRPAQLSIHGREGHSLCRTTAPEEPGAFAFPPIGAVITAAARLMLALLERCVADAGGTYAFADTDSMAIVASKKGGLVPCPGGSSRLPDGTPAIRALSWQEVHSIVDRFEALNPYDRSAVPGSILRIEPVNFSKGRQWELQAFVISAKRYALFTLGTNGPTVCDGGYSEHGLGQLLNPIDPEREDRDWIRHVWQGLVREALGGKAFDPPWGGRPAMMRSAVTTPVLLDRFRSLNDRKSFAAWVKPFNFLLSAVVEPIERPPERSEFQLVAAYSNNPSEWKRLQWIDLHSGDRFRIRTNGRSSPVAIRVQTYRDVLDRFQNHPESKSAGPNGSPSDARTTGLLGRLHVSVLTVFHIGKETNRLEEQEEGVLVEDPQAVYPGSGERETLRKRLQGVSIAGLSKRTEISERMLRDLRSGSRNPSPKTLAAILRELPAIV